MCGRFVVLTREEVAAVVAAVERGEWLEPLDADVERAQAFPGNSIQAFGAPDGRLAIGSFLWGFPLEWSKKPVFNTRIESALSGSGMWAPLIGDGRCIVPAARFFEPHASETVRSPKTGRQIKRAYEFAGPDGTPLLLAGLTDGAHCSIVTTEPNRWVSPIHNRMPLVLRFEEVPIWLGGSLTEAAALADRSAYELDVEAEQLQTGSVSDAGASPQLTLF